MPHLEVFRHCYSILERYGVIIDHRSGNGILTTCGLSVMGDLYMSTAHSNIKSLV